MDFGQFCTKPVSKIAKLEKTETIHGEFCEFCGKDFLDSNYQAHIKSCETEYEERYKGKKYQCKKCKRSFDHSASLR